MEKTQDAFRTIGEVAEELDLPQHVLRFWETKFTQIRPVKRAGGRRYYRPDDVQLLSAIRILLYSEGYTIKGVQRILKEQGVRAVVTASQGSVRGATVLSLSERRARGAAPEYLVEVPLEDVLADDPGPQDDFFESAPPAPPAPRELTRDSTCLSPQDRHRLEAILGELNECAKTLKDAAQEFPRL
jgi:DNA-binding transcriptional MerR regulator